MKLNEMVELNGIEYALELNRDSFVQIDKICNISKSFAIINRGFYDYVEEIEDDYNPLENIPSEEEMEKEMELKEKTLENLVERSFYIWLYPNYKFTITQVKEIIKPYLEDEKKAEFIGKKVGQLLKKCVDMRESYNQERKNLLAQVNK